MTICGTCLQEFNVAVRCQSCQAVFWQADKLALMRKRIRDLETLLACYRVGKIPSNKLLDRLVESESVSEKMRSLR